MNGDSSRQEHSCRYTTKEVIDKKIPTGGKKLPLPKNCKYCGKKLYHECLVMLGRVVVVNAYPQRCDCKKAVAFWKDYDERAKERKAKEEELNRRQQWQRKIERLIGKSGIKERFLDRTFNNFVVTDRNKKSYDAAKDYVDNFDAYKRKGKGISFEGTCGTGKTHLAVAIAIELLKKGIPVACKTSIELLNDIQEAIKSDKSKGEIIELYSTIDLLVIDDIGKEKCTEWSLQTLYAILTNRYESYKPTIITTNYNETELIQRMTIGGDSRTGEAIISRLRECNRLVTMAWDDYRSVIMCQENS